MRSRMADLALSLMVLCAVVMSVAAFFAFRRGDKKQGGLMLVLAVVLAINVAIWTIPGPDEASLSQAGAAAD
jgi:lipopolysaccharide export LptBFGC system permease protein LptF